jgi:carbonic anhydrase
MDARLNPYDLFDLGNGDAHVLRNAGAVITDDVLRSLEISQTALNTTEIRFVVHTDCGVRGGQSAGELEGQVRAAVKQLRSADQLPCRDEIRGYVYDVFTTEVHEISVD